MKWAFLISGIVELLGGLISYFYPIFLYDESTYLSQLMGLLAFVLGVINLLFFRYYEESALLRKVFVALLFYHGALPLICYKIPSSVWTQHMMATYLHLAVFIFFVIVYLKDVKPDIKS